MFNKAKRFQNITSEIGSKKLGKKCSAVLRKCETPKAAWRREGTFVISKEDSILRQFCPTQSTPNQKEEAGVIYKTERCIIRRTSPKVSPSAANNSSSIKPSPLRTPRQEDSNLCYSSDRCTIRRTNPKAHGKTSSEGSTMNGTSPSNKSPRFSSKTLEIEVSSNIHNEADKNNGKNSSTEQIIQRKTLNKNLQKVQGVKGLDLKISSPNIFDGKANLCASSDSLSHTDVEIKISSSNSAHNSSALSKSIQSALNDAVRKLRLLSSQSVLKTTKETEKRLENFKSELKELNSDIVEKSKWDSNKVLNAFSSTVRAVLKSEDNEKLWNIINNLRYQLKESSSKNRRLEDMYKKICEDNARKDSQQSLLIEQLREEVAAMEITFRMSKIYK